MPQIRPTKNNLYEAQPGECLDGLSVVRWNKMAEASNSMMHGGIPSGHMGTVETNHWFSHRKEVYPGLGWNRNAGPFNQTYFDLTYFMPIVIFGPCTHYFFDMWLKISAWNCTENYTGSLPITGNVKLSLCESNGALVQVIGHYFYDLQAYIAAHGQPSFATPIELPKKGHPNQVFLTGEWPQTLRPSPTQVHSGKLRIDFNNPDVTPDPSGGRVIDRDFLADGIYINTTTPSEGSTSYNWDGVKSVACKNFLPCL